jgi:Uma2 family endonuclease
MTTQQKLMTADELWRLPNDGMRHELVRGELRKMPPSGMEHAGLTSKIDRSLGSYVEQHGLGWVGAGDAGFKLETDPDTVRGPDVAFLRSERFQEVGLVTGFVPGVPDLAIEVISPNDLYWEVEEKVAEYLEHGTRMVVVVNPRRRTVTVHRPGQRPQILTEQDVLDGEDVVPGWSMPVADIFR